MSLYSTTAIEKLIWCRDAKEHIKPVEYLIHGILPVESKASLVGDYGTMKTFMALDMAISIASGEEWFGRVTVQRPVLYIVGEHPNGFLIRLWTSVGVEKDIPVIAYPDPIRLLDIEEVEKARELCLHIEEVEGNKPLVIIDTLNRNFGDGDENSTRDMTAFTNQLDEYIFPYSSGFLLLHHTPKFGQGSRGSVVLPGYLDTEFTISKTTAGGLAATLRITKSKDDESGNKFYLDFKKVETEFKDNIDKPVITLVLDSVKGEKPGMSGKTTNKGRIAEWLWSNPGFHDIDNLCSKFKDFGYSNKDNMKKAVMSLIKKPDNDISMSGDSVGAVSLSDSSTLIPMSPIGDILEG